MALRLLFLVFAASAITRAEFLRIEVSMKDMDCATCSDSLAKALEKMHGVKQVDVNMKDRSATVQLADQNRITVEQVWDTVKRIGFTPGETRVTARGAVKGGVLTVSLISKKMDIEGRAADSESVELKGSVMPPPDPNTRLKLRLASDR